MGMSKALMEKVVVSKAGCQMKRRSTQRYGNVMASRGSVIPRNGQIQAEQEITITDPAMTRFMMTLEDAVELVLHAFQFGQGRLFVQKSPAATIETLAKSIMELMGRSNHPSRVIGTRHGEKLFEVLQSREEMYIAEDQGEFYRVPADFRDLNYDAYFEKGERSISRLSDYNSHNTRQLNSDELTLLLKRLPIFNGL